MGLAAYLQLAGAIIVLELAELITCLRLRHP
jgi:hypothetical protein